MFRERPKITFKIEICVEDDDNGFHAYCSALKGVHVGGETIEEALENAKEAVILYIKSLIKHGDPIPLTPVDVVEDYQSISSATFCPPQNRYTEDISLAI